MRIRTAILLSAATCAALYLVGASGTDHFMPWTTGIMAVSVSVLIQAALRAEDV